MNEIAQYIGLSHEEIITKTVERMQEKYPNMEIMAQDTEYIFIPDITREKLECVNKLKADWDFEINPYAKNNLEVTAWQDFIISMGIYDDIDRIDFNKFRLYFKSEEDVNNASEIIKAAGFLQLRYRYLDKIGIYYLEVLV